MEGAKESDHASKIKEARDARRKRILARSSERLAYITGEGKVASPCSSASLDFDAGDNRCVMKAGDELKHQHQPESCDNRPKVFSETHQHVKACEASGDALVSSDASPTFPSPKSLQIAEESSASPRKLHLSIHHSLVPRAICAACMAFLVVGRTTLMSCSLPWGSPSLNHLHVPYWPVALVVAMDFIFIVGALLLHPTAPPNNQNMYTKGMILQPPRSCTKRALSCVATVMDTVAAIALDCSIYVALIAGGLSLASYCSFSSFYSSNTM